MDDQKLETQPSSEGQQLHSQTHPANTTPGIVSESGVVGAEVAEGERVEVPAMSGIAEGAEIGIVRGLDADAAAGAHQAMKFLHGGDHVGEVLDDVDGAQLVERVIGER